MSSAPGVSSRENGGQGLGLAVNGVGLKVKGFVVGVEGVQGFEGV